MTFLPLIERELRLRARSPAAYWTRFVVALAGALICLPQLFSSGTFATPASTGRGVFNGIVIAAFLVILGACVLTANALNTDQREGTLGLLLLTRVRELDVLLGKLGSIGITSVCVLLAFLPMLMLPVLAGGVGGAEALRKGLGLLGLLFFALAAGLYAAVRQRERFKAARFGLLVVSTVILAPYLLGLLLGRGMIGTPPPLPSLLSPLVLMISAGDLAYRASAGCYWISLSSLAALSCLLLARACVRLRRGLRAEEATTAAPTRVPPISAENLAGPRRRHSFAGEASPIAWRVRRQPGLTATVWAAALVGFLYYGVFAFFLRFVGPSSAGGITWSFGLVWSAVTGSLCAWAASRFFVEARRTGELELLLTTPIGARTIVSDQWEVLKRVFRWPLVVMLVPTFLQGLFYVVVRPRFGLDSAWYIQYVTSLAFGAVNTVLGLGALCWLALWFGLRAGGQTKAILWSVAVGKALPYGIGLLFFALRGVVAAPRWGSFSAWYWMTSLLPDVVNALYYLWLIRMARRCLLGNLAAANPMHLDLRRAATSTSRDFLATFHKVRHWTPS
jgi:hypothetical protein